MEALSTIIVNLVDSVTKLGLSSQDIFEIIVGIGISSTWNWIKRGKVPDKEKLLAEKAVFEVVTQESKIEVCKKLACFQTFKNYSETFEYFGDRMEGKGKEQAKRIDVTYFVDRKNTTTPEEVAREAAKEAAEDTYFAKQINRIIHNKLIVRRILLIQNNSDYKKMKEQLSKLGKYPEFGLGVYVLSGSNDNNEAGDLIKHINFNFMVIDSEEFCFNNGNRENEDPAQGNMPIHMASITHKKLAEEMKKHIDYLWKHSLKVKTIGEIDINQTELAKIEQKCNDNGYDKEI